MSGGAAAEDTAHYASGSGEQVWGQSREAAKLDALDAPTSPGTAEISGRFDNHSLVGTAATGPASTDAVHRQFPHSFSATHTELHGIIKDRKGLVSRAASRAASVKFREDNDEEEDGSPARRQPSTVQVQPQCEQDDVEPNRQPPWNPADDDEEEGKRAHVDKFINYGFMHGEGFETLRAGYDWDHPDSLASLFEKDSPEDEARRLDLMKKVFTYAHTRSKTTYEKYLISGATDGSLAEGEGTRRLARRKANSWAIQRWWWHWKDSTLREDIYNLLSRPESSRAAWWMSTFLTLVIVLNTITFCMETIPAYDETHTMTILNNIDLACLAIFTLEYLTRLACAADTWAFIKHPWNIIDLLAILPFYIDLAVTEGNLDGGGGASQTRILRLIRLFRLLRLLKVGQKFQNLQVVLEAFVTSVDVLVMLVFLLVILLVIFGTIIYYIEGPDSDPGKLDSIPAAMYYIQTTLTTTGYGDITPSSDWGKFAAGVLMLFALVTLALPISVISTNFSTLYAEHLTMKTAADRSSQVWSNFKQISSLFDQHRKVMDDVMDTLRDSHDHLDEVVLALKEKLTKARVAYVLSAAKAKEGSRPELEDLKESVDELKELLEVANVRFEGLQAVLDVSAVLRADEFLLRLDRMHLAYKNMRKWFEEGDYLVGEVRQLRSDVQAVKQAIKELS